MNMKDDRCYALPNGKTAQLKKNRYSNALEKTNKAHVETTNMGSRFVALADEIIAINYHEEEVTTESNKDKKRVAVMVVSSVRT